MDSGKDTGGLCCDSVTVGGATDQGAGARLAESPGGCYAAGFVVSWDYGCVGASADSGGVAIGELGSGADGRGLCFVGMDSEA